MSLALRSLIAKKNPLKLLTSLLEMGVTDLSEATLVS